MYYCFARLFGSRIRLAKNLRLGSETVTAPAHYRTMTLSVLVD
jgi:hypothetical protein